VPTASAHFESEWLEEVKTDREPHDATYFIVEAPDRAAIQQAIDDTSRYAKWPGGDPLHRVLDERETKPYPAKDIG
jgi:hypothetical protein